MDVREEHRTKLGDAPLGVLHSGGRYSFGFGPDFYGIWDAAGQDSPIERFPATPEGRHEGIARYIELEPSAQPALAPQREGDEEEEIRGRRGRWIAAGVILAIAIGAVVALAVLSGGGQEAGEISGGGERGTTAHVETSGAFTINEDLQQGNVQISGIGTLYPRVRAAWTGTEVKELRVVMNNPRTGAVKTNELANQRLQFTVDVPGLGETDFESVHGECTITVTLLEEDAFSGTFECTALTPPGAESPIDAKGTFAATA